MVGAALVNLLLLIIHAPAGIVVHRRGEIVFGNPELCRILNIDDIDEIPGRDILYLFHRDDREEASSINARASCPGSTPSAIKISCFRSKMHSTTFVWAESASAKSSSNSSNSPATKRAQPSRWT